MDDIRKMFLRQSMLDCEETFREAIARRDAPAWDWLVITAANDAQAAAYRAQVDSRLAAGLLPRQTRYAVIADPDGKRVGNGGATLNVLREIAQAEGGDAPFSMKKILVLHSGGDSQRVPQYSACGKLFARVPRALWDGRPSTLFDEFLVSLSCVPARMHGGMLVMCGDVLLLFNALQIDLERVGAACLSMRAPVQLGTRHGVFLGGQGTVRRFLHKQTEETLRAAGAVGPQDTVDIDTGAIWLDEQRVEALYALVKDDDEAFGRFVNERVRLSFYGDFVYPMAEDATLEQYLQEAPENVASAELAACRRALWDALNDTKLSLIRLAPAEFIHFGTTREWRDLLLHGEERFGFLGWRRQVQSVGAKEDIAAINSVIASGAQIGPGSAIEDSRIGPNARIGAGCVVSCAQFDGELAPGTALHALPIDDGEIICTRTYAVEDNPKEASRFGQALDGPLWTAPLHPVRRAGGAETGELLSLQASFARANMGAVLAWQAGLTDDVRAERVALALSSDMPVAEVLPLISQGEAGRRQLAMLSARAERAAFPLRHRLYYTLARAGEAYTPADAEEYDNACWRAINDHMQQAGRDGWSAERPQIRLGRAEVALPVRVNWGGGWSDTPPYCLEHGGAVLNCALTLCGENPVRAVAQRLAEPVVRVESRDLGIARTYTRLEELAGGNPHDPHALCKAALAVLGVIPSGGAGPVAPLLAQMGGGLLLITDVVHVPKGSGLGTSSILCAAVARALLQLLGRPDDDDAVASVALLMEQWMNTGGGWQDQVGGLLPGIKLTSSHPGTPQRLISRRIVMPDAAFDELSARHALVFTGQRRMARGLLREIMGKAVAGQPETMHILANIQRLAVLMAFELETGDIDQFARMLREHWALSKRLDAGSSNTCIDHMLTVIDDLIDGMMITGAGGGGFMSVILRKGVSRQMLSDRLDAVFQQSGVAVWDAELQR